jgi:hypothetical protein
MKNSAENAVTIAKHYFELSNNRNLEAIEKLLTDSTTYSSQNTGVYLGRSQIMEMKRSFYGNFKEMHWDVASVEEIRPGVILLKFTFTGKTLKNEDVSRPGFEYVIVYKGKIQHIEVRNS